MQSTRFLIFSGVCAVLFLVCVQFVSGVSFEEDVRITLDEKKAIEKLKSRVLPYIVEDFMKDDIYLVKWLRATNFDVSRAEKKMLDNIKWRKDNKMATIEQEDFSDVALEYPYLDNGFDKEGRPLFIAFAGDWDIRGAVVTGRAPRVIRYMEQGLEMVARRIRKFQSQGKNVTQGVLIIDLTNFSLVTHACVQCLIRIVDFLYTYENHFPGMADKVFGLDAPPAVQFVVELVKQNVSKESRDAIRVYGTNKQQWQSVLQKYIDRQYLPVEMGGTYIRN